MVKFQVRYEGRIDRWNWVIFVLINWENGFFFVEMGKVVERVSLGKREMRSSFLYILNLLYMYVLSQRIYYVGSWVYRYRVQGRGVEEGKILELLDLDVI